jgi:translation initiation factor IF-2
MSSSISNLSFSNILAAVRGASESERAELYALLPVPKVPAPAKEAKAPAKEATKPAKAPAKAPAKPAEEDEARDKRLMGRMSKEDQANLSKEDKKRRAELKKLASEERKASRSPEEQAKIDARVAAMQAGRANKKASAGGSPTAEEAEESGSAEE